MIRRWLRSMSAQLTAVFVTVVAIVLLVHNLPLTGYLEDVERDRLITGYERDAFIIAARVSSAIAAGTLEQSESINAFLQRYAAEKQVEVVVTDDDAIAVASSDPTNIGEDFDNRPEVVEAISSSSPTVGSRYSQTLDANLVFVSVPVIAADSTLGVVRISSTDQAVSNRVAERLQGLVTVAGLALVIAMLAAGLFARTISQPLRRLAQTTGDFAQRNLSARADEKHGPSEVRAVAASFNEMANRTEHLIERQRAFASTASHQLRTPLTALRLRLEQIAGRVDDDTADSVAAALTETERLGRMIEGLLELSRAEDTLAKLESVDLGAVVRERVEFWEPLATESEVCLVVEAPRAATVIAVPGAVEHIIDNLVDNALDVAPPASQITVTVSERLGQVELHVIDAGPGMRAVERANAFERFWRGEQAPTGGSGLGLAIVQQLAVAGGGNTVLERSAAGGIDAVVTFRPA